jgi:hypothetical protein
MDCGPWQIGSTWVSACINIDEARCAVRGVPGAASMVFYYEAIATMSLSDAVRGGAVYQTQRM